MAKMIIKNNSYVMVQAWKKAIEDKEADQWQICHALDFIEDDWQIEARHVFRQSNMCADVLAKMGVQQQSKCRILVEPPGEILNQMY